MNTAALPPLNPARVSPFGAGLAQHRPNRSGQVHVQLRASTVHQLIQINTWMGGWPALAAQLSTCLPALPAMGQSTSQGRDWIARTGPEELWLLAAPDSPLPTQVLQALPPEVGHCLDLSHARCRLTLQGAKAVAALQKCFALDFRPAAFAVGAVRLSGAHHLPALLHRTAADAFDVYLHTTYAHDQAESLLDAALEWGAEFSIG